MMMLIALNSPPNMVALAALILRMLGLVIAIHEMGLALSAAMGVSILTD
jgi:hypothetical protein